MIKKSFKTFLYLIATFLILFQSVYATNIVRLSPEYFPNSSIGRALSSADIYVGKPDLDPEVVANQKQLSVQQESGTIVNVSQPISTGAGGVPLYNGSPVTLLVEGDYSLKVNDSSGSQIYYIPSVASQSLVPGNFYYPDYNETDQGIAGDGNSVEDILTAIGGATNATMYFAHNSGSTTTTYTFTTNTAITSNFNIIIENGVILDGAGTLTINGPFETGLYQLFGSSITVIFGNAAVKEVYPEWWGAIADGTTESSTAIESAIATGIKTVGSQGVYYLGRTAIDIPANSVLYADPEITSFTVDVSDDTLMPATYFNITGSNVVIDGIYLNFASMTTVFLPGVERGRFITVGAASLSNITVKNCRSFGVWNSVYAADTTADTTEHVTIINNRFVSYHDDILWQGESPTNVKILGNTFSLNRLYYAAIVISPGFIAGVDEFTETMYTDHKGEDIMIANNNFLGHDSRPVRLWNINRLNVSDNLLSFTKGAHGDTNIPGDVLTVDFVRNFVIKGNTIEGGGENGIDILSSQNGVVSSNIIHQVDTVGIYIGISDLWTMSGTTPKLDTFADRQEINVRDIVVSDNKIEAHIGIQIHLGQNIKVHDNIMKPNNVSTRRISGTEYLPLSITDTVLRTSYYTAASDHWMRNIKCINNQNFTSGFKSVTFTNATNLITADSDHGYVTGTQIQLLPSGTGTTVDYPTGLNYHTVYYVIRISSDTFKVASSWNNAFTGTAVTFSDDGLTVGGSVIISTEPEVILGHAALSASYTYANANIEFDENMPAYMIYDEFSSIAAIAAVSVPYKNVKFDYILDPADAHHSTVTKIFFPHFIDAGYHTKIVTGTATLLNGNTTILVTHGLGYTPTAGEISVTPIENWGSMTEFFVDTLGATQFRINADQDPGEDVDFSWSAVMTYGVRRTVNCVGDQVFETGTKIAKMYNSMPADGYIRIRLY